MSALEHDEQLQPLEIATGLAFGDADGVEAVSRDFTGTPLEALEHELLPALDRSPCIVSFSGGRDSSCVLAAATALARREGLPLPVPATNFFAGAPNTEESEWQERVVAHLELPEWIRLGFVDELDAVGPIACAVLRRHGLLWPFNAHFHVPLLEAAADGALVTGVGGDEVLGVSRWNRANAVLERRVRPAPCDVLAVTLALSPLRLRRLVLTHRRRETLSWLRPTAQRALRATLAAEEAAEPRVYHERVRWWRRRRSVRLGFRSLSLLAADAGATIVHPLATSAFGSAAARIAPVGGPSDRGAFMRQIFGNLLPDAVYGRVSKATFDEAFWRIHARALAQRWNGEGVPTELVDAEGLRAQWARPVPDGHTYTLLQAAWLARNTPTRGSA